MDPKMDEDTRYRLSRLPNQTKSWDTPDERHYAEQKEGFTRYLNSNKLKTDVNSFSIFVLAITILVHMFVSH